VSGLVTLSPVVVPDVVPASVPLLVSVAEPPPALPPVPDTLSEVIVLLSPELQAANEHTSKLAKNTFFINMSLKDFK
jgi:hypothetical protein